MECEAGGLARARIAGARSCELEADLVDDAKADERGQRKADADGEQVNIDGQPVECDCVLLVLSGFAMRLLGDCSVVWLIFGGSKRKSPRIALCADAWTPEFQGSISNFA
jgi:hypothetical protein